MLKRNMTCILALVLLVGTGFLASCASSRSGQVYSRDFKVESGSDRDIEVLAR